MMTGERRLRSVIATFLVAVSIAAVAAADERTDYLIKLLETSDNHRVRVQAATTLGKLRKKKAVPALTKALFDNHELVVISAAAALSRIGDPRSVPALKKSLKAHKDEAVRSQIRATLRVVEAIASGGRDLQKNGGRARYLIRVDAMGNSSGALIGEAEGVLKKIVLERMDEDSRVVVQKDRTSAKEVKKKLAARALRGYIVSGAVIKLETVGDQIVAKIALNVFTNPDYNLLMMPTAEGKVPCSTKDKGEVKKAQLRAIRIVAESLMSGIFQALEQLDE